MAVVICCWLVFDAYRSLLCVVCVCSDWLLCRLLFGCWIVVYGVVLLIVL